VVLDAIPSTHLKKIEEPEKEKISPRLSTGCGKPVENE
jgi:hypothetical protein